MLRKMGRRENDVRQEGNGNGKNNWIATSSEYFIENHYQNANIQMIYDTYK